MQLLDLDAFVDELDAFVLDRTLRPRLSGTYDTFLAFEAVGNAVLFSYCLGDALMGRPTHRFTQTGSFEIDDDTLSSIVGELREMTSERHDTTSGSSTTH